MKRGSLRHDALGFILNGDDFKAASMSGDSGRGGLPWGHRLPAEWADEYLGAVRNGLIAFTVYSYGTPIAWRLKDGMRVVPDVRYSATTGRHQAIARRAYDVPRGETHRTWRDLMVRGRLAG